MADAKSIQEPVVKALAEYISSFQFQRTFEEFFLNNALKFTDEQEHQLDYMTIYLDFQTLFNQQMEGEFMILLRYLLLIVLHNRFLIKTKLDRR